MKKHLKVLWMVLVIAIFFILAVASEPSKSDLGKTVNDAKSSGDIQTTSAVQTTISVTNEVPEASIDVSTASPTESPTDAPETDITISEKVIYNKNNIKITAKSISTDDLIGVSLKLLIENNSKQNITVQSADSAINGFMIDSLMSSDVAAGKKSNDEILFTYSDLEMATITIIKDIEFQLHIFNADNYNDIDNSGLLHITTSADPNFIQTYDGKGFVALDKNKIKVVVQKLNDTTSIWGAELNVYVENNSDKYITIQVDNVSLNGFMMNPIFSCDVDPGKKAVDTITFLSSDLEDNNITKFESLELSFHIFNSVNYNKIYDSKIVKVAFSE